MIEVKITYEVFSKDGFQSVHVQLLAEQKKFQTL